MNKLFFYLLPIYCFSQVGVNNAFDSRNIYSYYFEGTEKNNKNKNKQRPQQRSDESVVPAKDLSVNDDTTTEDEPTEKKQPQHNRQKKRPHHKHKPKNNTAEQKAIDPIVKTPENKPEIVVNTDSSSDDISKKKTRKNWLQRLLKD